MGLSSLAVVMNIIDQVSFVDLQLLSLTHRKMGLSSASMDYQQMMSEARNTEDNGVLQVQLYQLNDNGHIKWDDNGSPVKRTKHVFNQYDTGVQDKTRQGTNIFAPLRDPITGKMQFFEKEVAGVKTWAIIDPDHFFTVARADGVTPAKGSVRNAAGNIITNSSPSTSTGADIEPGKIFMKKGEAQALFKRYLAEINHEEKGLDMEMKSLEAKRSALMAQRETFDKYVAEGIKLAFKNSYA